MRELPSGTVTFLFTDVEGSTKLLHELGAEAYDEALITHRSALREAFRRHGGVEVDTQGDAFFYAFPTAPGAVDAAREGIEALSSGPIRIRVGLHTGTPHIGQEGYIGEDVHLGARIAATAHGGQVVLSQATADSVELALTDLGEHRLKDIPEAVAIFQLGDGSFPPLKTISNTNLPVPASSFVGRDDERLGVLSRFEDGARLVTLTGPGGTGKTRLAIEVAATLVPELKAGVFWVGLAPLRDPALVTETIAQTLGANDGLAERIADRELLLLLDNLEQVIEAAPDLSELLTVCPNLRLLVTSRELLRVSGEVEYAVPPLSEPEAVELFCTRSQMEPDETIAELCRRLDDMPLAVELAAARTSALTPKQVLERLSQRLDLLKGGRDADPRQQTLRATIEWSYDLLSTNEQQLFARLSVFDGGCTLEAADEVCDADLDMLQSLVEKSLVRFTNGRYWMLETIRELATEKLEESNEADGLRAGHATFFAEIADRRWPELVTGEGEWRDVVEHEHENLRQAVEWALVHGDGETALAVASGVWPFWLGRGYSRQGRVWLERALELPGASTEQRAHTLAGLADFAKFQGDLDAAERASSESLSIFRELGDTRWESAALSTLADLAITRGDLPTARQLADESVALRREVGSFGLGRGLISVAEVARAEGDVIAEMAALQEALEWQQAEQSESTHMISLLTLSAAAALRGGDLDRAQVLLVESLQIAARRGGADDAVGCIEGFAHLAAASADHERAARLAGWTERMNEELGFVRSRLDPPLPERIEPAWSEGRAMSLDEAVEYAWTGID